MAPASQVVPLRINALVAVAIHKIARSGRFTAPYALALRRFMLQAFRTDSTLTRLRFMLLGIECVVGIQLCLTVTWRIATFGARDDSQRVQAAPCDVSWRFRAVGSSHSSSGSENSPSSGSSIAMTCGSTAMPSSSSTSNAACPSTSSRWSAMFVTVAPP